MVLLDNLLGGGDNASESHSSTDIGGILGTNPGLSLAASDILHSENTSDGDSGSFTGVGDLAVGFSAPTVVGVNVSNEQHDAGMQGSDNGGLLGGLL